MVGLGDGSTGPVIGVGEGVGEGVGLTGPVIGVGDGSTGLVIGVGEGSIGKLAPPPPSGSGDSPSQAPTKVVSTKNITNATLKILSG